METNDWNDAERRVERAQELFEQRKWPEALAELRAATSINPYNASWYFNIGLTLDEMGRFDEAIGAYREALEIDSDDVQALHHLGLDLHQVGRFEDAIKTFNRVQIIDPSYEPSYCARIITYSELGDHERADEMFYLARLYKEHCEQCYFNIGVSLAARGQYAKAIFCFNRTLDRHDDWPEAHFRIAKAFHLKGDLEQARRHYLSGLRQDPGCVDALLDLAELLIEMQRLDEAGEKIRHAIELVPEEPNCHCAHGRWLLLVDRPVEARSALLKALQLDPTCHNAHLCLGKIDLQAGEIESARGHLRSELLLRPEDPRTLYDLGNLALDVNDTRSALGCFKRITQTHPQDVSAWLNLGVTHFLRNRYSDGIAACERALQVDPQHLAGHFNLALALSHRRDFNRAIAVTRDGLSQWPNDVSLQRLQFRLKLLRVCDRLIGWVRGIWR